MKLSIFLILVIAVTSSASAQVLLGGSGDVGSGLVRTAETRRTSDSGFLCVARGITSLGLQGYGIINESRQLIGTISSDRRSCRYVADNSENGFVCTFAGALYYTGGQAYAIYNSSGRMIGTRTGNGNLCANLVKRSREGFVCAPAGIFADGTQAYAVYNRQDQMVGSRVRNWRDCF